MAGEEKKGDGLQLPAVVGDQKVEVSLADLANLATRPGVLEDQLTGVDTAEFGQIIGKLRKEGSVDNLLQMIDEVFE